MLLCSERVSSDLLLATLLYTLNYATLNSSLLYSLSCSTLQEKNSFFFAPECDYSSKLL